MAEIDERCLELFRRPGQLALPLALKTHSLAQINPRSFRSFQAHPIASQQIRVRYFLGRFAP